VGEKSRSRKDRKAISNAIVIIMMLIIAAVVGALLWLKIIPMFKGGATVSFSITGSADSYPDGSGAALRIMVTNLGDVKGTVLGVYVAPASGTASVSGVTAVGLPAGTLDVGTSPPTDPTTITATGIDVNPKDTKGITLELSGSGLFAGEQLKVYLLYKNPDGSYDTIQSVVSIR